MKVSAILIKDPETTGRIRRLAALRGESIVVVVNDAVSAELIRLGDIAKPSPKDMALAERLDARIREVTLANLKKIREVEGKPSGSRVYAMLGRRGSVGTLTKLVAEKTKGFDWCHVNGLPDLAYETIACDPVFASILSAETIGNAKRRMADYFPTWVAAN